MSGEEALCRRDVYYSGRVQGVGFRYTVASIARDYEVTGYVRNLRDGRVELVVEGAMPEIEHLLAAIADRMSGYIRGTEVKEPFPTGQFREFDIRF